MIVDSCLRITCRTDSGGKTIVESAEWGQGPSENSVASLTYEALETCIALNAAVMDGDKLHLITAENTLELCIIGYDYYQNLVYLQNPSSKGDMLRRALQRLKDEDSLRPICYFEVRIGKYNVGVCVSGDNLW